MDFSIYVSNFKRRNSIIVLCFMLLCSCKEKKVDETQLNKQSKSQGINVTTTLIKPKIFQTQLISNGKIETKGKANLRFKTNERITKIYVKNGQKITKGAVLAKLENALLLNQIQQAKLALKKAEVALTKEKINFEIYNKDESTINPNILKTVYTNSGYKEAKTSLENTQLLYNQTFLKAPFSGVITNLTTKVGNHISNAAIFCTLLSNSKVKGQTEVLFSVLEQEIKFIKKGLEVDISSFADKENIVRGNITEINPLVNENGLIQVKATLNEVNTNFINGINVKIIINQPINDVIVIPKKALVLRSNKEVVFTVKNSLAKWNYVEILEENSTSYAIKKGLKIGDTIIVSGNLNLAHDAVVNAKFIKE